MRRLNIVYCISCFWPVESGAERQARRQGRELVRRGHRVSVLTLARPGSPDEEEVEGIRVLRWIRPVSLGPLFGASFLIQTRRALLRLGSDTDIIHCHQGLWEAAAVGWARPRLPCPSLVQPAASGPFGEYHQWKQTRGRQILRSWILRNDLFVAISDAIRAELLLFGVPADRIRLVGSGVDLDEFSPGPSPLEGILPPRPRVVFTGRLHPQKNLPLLLHAWQQVVRKIPASLLLVGDGPQRSDLRQLATSLGIEHAVHFAGHQTDVLPYLRAADIFVLPSRAEGMSNSLLEAMAVGLPAVVSRIGGNTDLVAENRTGYLADPNDPADLARAILLLLRDPELRRRMGQTAREFVRARYSLQAIVDRYEGIYRELSSKVRHPAGSLPTPDGRQGAGRP